MSAIFGIFHRDGKPLDPLDLERMKAPMAYWGPDGSGLWHQGPVGLGHLMLHNTPESVGDKLPRTNREGNLVLTAHARIDNRGELFGALDITGPDRVSMPDSELIMLAYEKWGEDCVHHLLGDWCFAVWDVRERRLFVARDHHGNTGLYYHFSPGRFVFSSCVKGVLAVMPEPLRMNELRVAQILVSWPGAGDETCYQGISRLPPSHRLTVTPKTVRKERYWRLEKTSCEIRLSSDRDYVEAFLKIYREAVLCRLRSHRPIGVTLSGGLDSGSVAALGGSLLRERGMRLQAFTSVPIYGTDRYVPAQRFGSELPYAEATARHVGNIDLHQVCADDMSPVQGILRALELHDEPGHAASNHYWIGSLLSQAEELGIGTLLTGQGGNATVSWHGGSRFARLREKGGLSELLREMRFPDGKVWTRGPRLTIDAFLGNFLWPFVPVRHRFGLHRMRRATAPWADYSAINEDLARKTNLFERMLEFGHDPFFSTNADPWELRHAYLGPGRSIVGALWQEMGAAFSMDAVDPTVDKRLVEFCLGIPNDQYVRDGKERFLIRRAFEGILPEEVLWNPRRGLQAADIGPRFVRNLAETERALTRIENTALAMELVDVPKMRCVLQSLRRDSEYRYDRRAVTILARGLMVGLFACCFTGVHDHESLSV